MAEKYRKKPVIINAMQMPENPTPTEAMEVYQWVESHLGSVDPDGGKPGVSISPATGLMIIKTLEGDMTVDKGDWVIQGVKGEFYPCKSDIFESTYTKI